MVTIKLEICFDSGQFVGGTKNLHNQCAVVIYAPKSLSYLIVINFAREYWKILE